jgi:hypothetical protein
VPTIVLRSTRTIARQADTWDGGTSGVRERL